MTNMGRRRMRHFVVRLARGWRQAMRRRAMRGYVMDMDPRMLADIGVSRAQALFEIDRAGTHDD